MPDVLIEKRDNGVALITLNRPDSLNAMGGDLMPMLANYLSECSMDDSVRCVVLTGAGRAFCAGGDVKQMAQGGIGLPGENQKPRSPAADFARGVEVLRRAQRETSYTLPRCPSRR